MSDSTVNQEYFNMHKEIIAEVSRLTDEVEFNDLVLVDSELQEQIRQLHPLSSVIDVPVNTEQYRMFINKIADIVLSHQQQLQETVTSILESLKSDEQMVLLIEATKQFNHFYFEDFSKKHNLNAPILQFLSELAYRPYIKAFAKLVNPKINLAQYNNNKCPVCGELVRIIRSVDEGGREACCVRCSTVWNAKRLQCPHCKNEDHEKLRYITVGEDEDRKLYVCEVCKGYVKYINTQELLVQPDFFLVDLETIYLDIVADQQGYGIDVESGNNKVM